MRRISFVIPCYKSEQTISPVIDEIRTVVQSRIGFEYEIIMVVDCSPDGVYQVVKRLCLDDPKLSGVELSKNFGQHSALLCGYARATGDIVFSLDDDGQAPIESIYAMIKAIDDGADVAFADYSVKRQSVFRHVGSRVNDMMTCWLLGKPPGLKTNSFFAAKRYVISEIVKYRNAYPYLPGLLLRVTRNIVNVRVDHRVRVSGRSGYTFAKLVHLWVNGFTAFSIKPLRVATWLGFLFAIVGFSLGLWVVVDKVIHPDIQAGYSSLMAVMLFIGGIMMLMLGLVGEYVGRIYLCINNAPQYVVRRSTIPVDVSSGNSEA